MQNLTNLLNTSKNITIKLDEKTKKITGIQLDRELVQIGSEYKVTETYDGTQTGVFEFKVHQFNIFKESTIDLDKNIVANNSFYSIEILPELIDKLGVIMSIEQDPPNYMSYSEDEWEECDHTMYTTDFDAIIDNYKNIFADLKKHNINTIAVLRPSLEYADWSMTQYYLSNLSKNGFNVVFVRERGSGVSHYQNDIDKYIAENRIPEITIDYTLSEKTIIEQLNEYSTKFGKKINANIFAISCSERLLNLSKKNYFEELKQKYEEHKKLPKKSGEDSATYLQDFDSYPENKDMYFKSILRYYCTADNVDLTRLSSTYRLELKLIEKTHGVLPHEILCVSFRKHKTYNTFLLNQLDVIIKECKKINNYTYTSTAIYNFTNYNKYECVDGMDMSGITNICAIINEDDTSMAFARCLINNKKPQKNIVVYTSLEGKMSDDDVVVYRKK